MRRKLSGILAVTMLSVAVISPGLAEQNVQAAEIIASGECGKSCTWTLDDTGTLTISGNGSMQSYSNFKDQPYGEYREEISAIVVEEGVTDIGNSAFLGSSYVTSVSLPNTLENIGERAFESLWNLPSIEIPASVKNIYGRAFYACRSLESVTLNEGLELIGAQCFYDADDLKELTIPASVTEIDRWAFGHYSLYGSYIGGGIALDETIYGYQGTAAERYALTDGIPFVPLDDVVLGDVTGDGIVDAFDLGMLKRYLNAPEDTTIRLSSANVNQDRKVDVQDCRMLQDYLLGNTRKFSENEEYYKGG